MNAKRSKEMRKMASTLTTPAIPELTESNIVKALKRTYKRDLPTYIQIRREILGV